MASQRWKENNQDKLRQYRRAWYERNKERAKASVIKRERELIRLVEARKAEIGCCMCSEKHPACLDFHHRDPLEKEMEISRIVQDRGWGIKRLEAEIAKCDVLCANCHRKLHWEERRQAQPFHDVIATGK